MNGVIILRWFDKLLAHNKRIASPEVKIFYDEYTHPPSGINIIPWRRQLTHWNAPIVASDSGMLTSQLAWIRPQALHLWWHMTLLLRKNTIFHCCKCGVAAWSARFKYTPQHSLVSSILQRRLTFWYHHEIIVRCVWIKSSGKNSDEELENTKLLLTFHCNWALLNSTFFNAARLCSDH